MGKIKYASEMLYEDPHNKNFKQVAFANGVADDLSKHIFQNVDEIKLRLEPLYKGKKLNRSQRTKQLNNKRRSYQT